MWLATKFGFYSIVQKQGQDGGDSTSFHVRARVRTDLESLLTATGLQREILEWPTADYRYRIVIDMEDLTHQMGGTAVWGLRDAPSPKHRTVRR